MAHDYAHRTARPQRSLAQSAAGTRFHLTSFASGALVGAVLAITAFLAPRWWPIDALEATASAGETKDDATNPDTGPKYVFYDELLKSKVRTETAAYDGPAAADVDKPSTPAPQATPAEASHEFVLQAGSFRAHDDAERLRQSLEDMGLESTTAAVRLGDGSQLNRVLVGPFATELDVHRASMQLKERNIDPLVMKR